LDCFFLLKAGFTDLLRPNSIFSVVEIGMSFVPITSVLAGLNFFREAMLKVDVGAGDSGEIVEDFLKVNKRISVIKHATKQIKKIFI